MNHKEIVKWVRKNGDRYIAVYGLQHWDIAIDVSDNEEADRTGECDTQPEYQLADITLYSACLMDEKDIHETLCHELEHILDSAFDMYRAVVNTSLPKNVRKVTDALYMQCVELARNNIGRFRSNVWPYTQTKRPEDRA